MQQLAMATSQELAVTHGRSKQTASVVGTWRFPLEQTSKEPRSTYAFGAVHGEGSKHAADDGSPRLNQGATGSNAN